MKLHTFRLKPGQDLRCGIEQFAKDNHIQAAFIVTCVGGLRSATLRMAGAKPDQQDIRTYEQDFEVVSLIGTITDGDAHLHISLSDKDGQVIGGHLKGSSIFPTAEVVLGEDDEHRYSRELDEETGFEELVVGEG